MKRNNGQNRERPVLDSAPTQWSQIALAANPDTPEGKAAQQRLAPRIYRLTYQAIRRFSPNDAEDGAQEFCGSEDVLTGRFFQRADPNKGRFRDNVAQAGKRTWIQLARKRRAQKRGGRIEHEYIDAPGGPSPVDPRPSPEDSCEVEWQLRVYAASVCELRAQYRSEGKGELFDILFEWNPDSNDAEVARRLGMSLGAARTRRSRFTKELFELCRKNSAEPRFCRRKG